MSRTGAEIKASELKSKFIQDRISLVEKHFGQLCDTLSSFTRKNARLRDKGDQLAKDLLDYTETETYNPAMVRSLSEFASNLSTIQDYRQAEVTRLESKVITPLANYGLKCKQAKNDIKSAFAAQDRESNQKKRLDKLRLKATADRSQISQAETELQKASVEASRITKSLEQQTDKFEVEKLKDIRKIMLDFVNIEMIFHAKALEIYSECFQNLKSFDVDEDIEEFRHKFHPPHTAARMNMVRSSSYSSLETTNQTTSPARAQRPSSASGSRNTTPSKTVSAQPTNLRPIPNGSRLGNGIEDDDDDDDEDDDDEDEDDDDDDDVDDDDDDDYTETETARTTERSTARGSPAKSNGLAAGKKPH